MLCLSLVVEFHHPLRGPIKLRLLSLSSVLSVSPNPPVRHIPLSCGNTMENHAGPQTPLHLTASVKQTLKDRESGGEKRGLVSQKTFQLNHVGDWKLFRLLLKVNFTQSWTHSWQWSWPRQPVSTWGSPSYWSPDQWWSGLRMFQSTDFANSGKHNFIFVPDGNNLC